MANGKRLIQRSGIIATISIFVFTILLSFNNCAPMKSAMTDSGTTVLSSSTPDQNSPSVPTPTPLPILNPPLLPMPMPDSPQMPAPTPTPSPVVVSPPVVSSPPPAPTPTPAPAPMPMPSTGTYLKVGAYDSFVGPTFDYNTLIGKNVPIPGNYGFEEGAFRFTCYASHLLYDDPIVYPGQPGMSHLHMFFGNSLANANSTYQTLRNTGNSSCGSILNRSAYWMPALLTPDEKQVIQPDIIVVYYKRNIDGAKACTTLGIDCKPLPRGFRFIFGYDFKTGNPGVARWQCIHKDGSQTGLVTNIVLAAKYCLDGDQLEATLDGQPDCWDGVNLDTPDHRSHIAYGAQDGYGNNKCPADHPYLIPRYTIKAMYTVDSTLDRSGTYTPGVTKTWHLSSDMMGKTGTPGETLHADWFGAWDDFTMNRWMKGCINGAENCNNGDLGDGGRIEDAAAGKIPKPPRLVPTPP